MRILRIILLALTFLLITTFSLCWYVGYHLGYYHDPNTETQFLEGAFLIVEVPFMLWVALKLTSDEYLGLNVPN